MNIPKTRVQIFLSADDLNLINKYGENTGKKTISEAINSIILEWRRFKTIAIQLQKEQEIRALSEMSKAKVIKE